MPKKGNNKIQLPQISGVFKGGARCRGLLPLSAPRVDKNWRFFSNNIRQRILPKAEDKVATSQTQEHCWLKFCQYQRKVLVVWGFTLSSKYFIIVVLKSHFHI